MTPRSWVILAVVGLGLLAFVLGIRRQSGTVVARELAEWVRMHRPEIRFIGEEDGYYVLRDASGQDMRLSVGMVSAQLAKTPSPAERNDLYRWLVAESRCRPSHEAQSVGTLSAKVNLYGGGAIRVVTAAVPGAAAILGDPEFHGRRATWPGIIDRVLKLESRVGNEQSAAGAVANGRLGESRRDGRGRVPGRRSRASAQTAVGRREKIRGWRIDDGRNRPGDSARLLVTIPIRSGRLPPSRRTWLWKHGTGCLT